MPQPYMPKPTADQLEDAAADEAVDEAADESFPASDAPSFTPVTGAQSEPPPDAKRKRKPGTMPPAKNKPDA